nr:o-succinylbenzoate synthase [Synechococcus sp. CCY 9618]
MQWRRFGFRLPLPLVTASGRVEAKQGWLLRLEASDGSLGWGEAAPLDPDDRPAVAMALEALLPCAGRGDLERALPGLPATVGFALGAALAEIDGEVAAGGAGGWLDAPPSAWLLPAGDAMLEVLERLPGRSGPMPAPLTLKWKVAALNDGLERALLERLLAWLPADGRLRLDANGGWDRSTAAAWADRLAGDPRLDWLEQPLTAVDQEGLERLGERIPVALDESLVRRPALRERWGGWQVRRPSQEGDPRGLLALLRQGAPRLMLSTGFETGIGARWTAHLAALQVRGPTPTAPGLAPGWSPGGPLFDPDPERVWGAVA